MADRKIMQNHKRQRVGAVSYLNTKPLVCQLAEIAPEIELVFDLPSRLADRLANGQLDVALIPSIEFLHDPDYEIVSDACIACRGPVLSVKLLSRVPMREIGTVALDEGSRTSVALTKILLQERFGIAPQCQSLPIGRDAGDLDTDAVLLIGDRAIHTADSDYAEIWDLGEQWCRWANLPFVFAMWTARRGVIQPSLRRAFEQARDCGLKQLDAIARHEATDVGLDDKTCLRYLRDNLHFHLGEGEQAGLRLFKHHAELLGLIRSQEEPAVPAK